MTLRLFYCFLLRIHPRAFRERFAQEMMAIFDEASATAGSVHLLGDALVSLSRQWLFRPHRQPLPASVGTLSGGMFHILDAYRPRRTALLQGGVMTVILFWAIAFAATQGGHPMEFQGGSPHAHSGFLTVSELTPPAAMRRVPAPGTDPWLDFASHYFKIIYVLRALDADHDYVISADEIAGAPAALRQLDLDGDGNLSGEEAGMCLGDGSLPGCGGEHPSGPETPGVVWSTEQREHFRAVFMAANPVLSALDADHDSKISWIEIRNAPDALKRLDLNGDGKLLPVEVAPDSIAKDILLRK